MKHIQTLVFMTLSGVALMFANNVSAQSTKQGTATVVRIQGEARYSVGDNVWHPLIAGKTLGAGAVIQTAVDSKVDVVLGDVPVQVSYPTSASQPMGPANAADPNVRGYVIYNPKVSQNVIRMFGNAVLAVDKLTVSDTGVDAVGDTELDLRAGKIFLTVKKISAMSQFEVKIPDGVAGIRGSSGTLEVDELSNLNNAGSHSYPYKYQYKVSWLTGECLLSLGGQSSHVIDIHGGNGFDSLNDSNNATPLSPADLGYLGQAAHVVPTYFPEFSYLTINHDNCYLDPIQ